ncbi:MAG: fused MFS/spermidine synthase [Planctomycetota bacterium]
MFFIRSLISFLGAFLLFQLELIVAQKLLPLYGGSFSVWASCMMFFQILLFLGYLYSYWLTNSAIRTKALFQILMLFLSVFLFPFHFQESTVFSHPVLSIGFQLTLTIGLPFFLLSSTSILQQKWLLASETNSSRTPYTLYSISNIGSFVALLSYPFLVQPFFSLTTQFQIWYSLYGIYFVLHFFCLPKINLAQNLEIGATSRKIALEQKNVIFWFFLSMGTSALLLAITNIITQDISPAPILWIFPLAAYLLSFILAFAEKKWFPALVKFSFLSTFLVLTGILLMRPNLVFWLFFYLLFLFSCSCLAHHLLFKLKPHEDHLVLFYIIISLGGCIGTIGINFIMPFLMRYVASLLIDIYGSLTLLLCCFLGYSYPKIKSLVKNPFFSGIALASLVIWFFLVPFTLFYPESDQLVAFRNFYGVSRVVVKKELKWLYHGTTIHGSQWIDKARETEPCLYFRPSGPFGDLFNASFPKSQIALIGLGVGSLIGYGTAEQFWDIYEINPDVDYLAKNYFSYLNHTKASLKIHLGDARIEIQKASPQQYQFLLIDAFSSDAIPVHLLTHEAFTSYLDKLVPDGVIAIHISNKYLNLVPILTKLADTFSLYSAYKLTPFGDPGEIFPAVRVFVMTSSQSVYQQLIQKYGWKTTKTVTPSSLWTDEKLNLLEAFSW